MKDVDLGNVPIPASNRRRLLSSDEATGDERGALVYVSGKSVDSLAVGVTQVVMALSVGGDDVAGGSQWSDTRGADSYL